MIDAAVTPQAIHLKDYVAPHYEVVKVDLDITLDPKSTKVINKMQFKMHGKDKSPILLHADSIVLDEILIDGKILDKNAYQLTDKGLELSEYPDKFELTVVNHFSPEANKALSGLYMSKDMYCTQCESQGFRRITFYPDRPDVLSTFTTTIRASEKEYPVMLSNGNPIEHKKLDGGMHQVTWKDPFKKPSYLFALVAGPLAEVKDSFQTKSGRNIELAFYVRPEDKNRCGHAIEALKKAMKWDEDTYGLEYDLDIYMVVAVSDFNMGAMENKGLNIFNTKYILADPQTATDKDYQLIEAVIGHEYFHNWSGNRVTCRDWFQLSLKEGLTVFREQQFSDYCGSPGVNRIEQANLMQTRQFAEDSSPLSHPIRPETYIEINNFYTLTVYEKGCEVIRMLHTLLGDKGFKNGMKTYFERHDGQAVTTEDFLKAHADANEKDLSQFSRWYRQAGTPNVQVTGHWNAQANKYQLHTKQSYRPAVGDKTPKEPVVIPMKVELLADDGSVLFKESVLEITKEDQTFTFDGIKERPIPALFSDFSAPVKFSYPYHNHEYGVMLKHSSDPFTRWNAAQKMIIETIEHLAKQRTNKKAMLLDSEVFSDFEPVVAESFDDLNFKALLLTLPTFGVATQALPNVNQTVLWEVYDYFTKFFSAKLCDDWKVLYAEHYAARKDDISHSASGNRQMANVSLGHLMRCDENAGAEQALNQYQNAYNMTEKMGALNAVNNSHHEVRKQLLELFLEEYQSNELAMDKWFALQASSTRDDTIDQVKNLLSHKNFSIQNPNKVYALLNTFAHNERHFHAESGEGYQLVADNIATIDKFNPQVAARLASAFSTWRRLDESRQAKVKVILKRLLDEQKLSNDTFEIISKTVSD